MQVKLPVIAAHFEKSNEAPCDSIALLMQKGAVVEIDREQFLRRARPCYGFALRTRHLQSLLLLFCRVCCVLLAFDPCHNPRF
jgi:hypothetical protein